ncbi:hypothetical protein NFI96_027526 [Prochilodus magdalenae]|nr:hypothetical protein NFI96_027526 [Prochilodus magdalenae]
MSDVICGDLVNVTRMSVHFITVLLFQHADTLSSMRLELQRAHAEEIRRLHQEVEKERGNDKQELEEEKKRLQQRMDEEKVRLKEQLRKALEEVIRKHASELRQTNAALDEERKKGQQLEEREGDAEEERRSLETEREELHKQLQLSSTERDYPQQCRRHDQNIVFLLFLQISKLEAVIQALEKEKEEARRREQEREREWEREREREREKEEEISQQPPCGPECERTREELEHTQDRVQRVQEELERLQAETSTLRREKETLQQSNHSTEERLRLQFEKHFSDHVADLQKEREKETRDITHHWQRRVQELQTQLEEKRALSEKNKEDREREHCYGNGEMERMKLEIQKTREMNSSLRAQLHSTIQEKERMMKKQQLQVVQEEDEEEETVREDKGRGEERDECGWRQREEELLRGERLSHQRALQAVESRASEELQAEKQRLHTQHKLQLGNHNDTLADTSNTDPQRQLTSDTGICHSLDPGCVRDGSAEPTPLSPTPPPPTPPISPTPPPPPNIPNTTNTSNTSPTPLSPTPPHTTYTSNTNTTTNTPNTTTNTTNTSNTTTTNTPNTTTNTPNTTNTSPNNTTTNTSNTTTNTPSTTDNTPPTPPTTPPPTPALAVFVYPRVYVCLEKQKAELTQQHTEWVRQVTQRHMQQIEDLQTELQTHTQMMALQQDLKQQNRVQSLERQLDERSSEVQELKRENEELRERMKALKEREASTNPNNSCWKERKDECRRRNATEESNEGSQGEMETMKKEHRMEIQTIMSDFSSAQTQLQARIVALETELREREEKGKRRVEDLHTIAKLQDKVSERDQLIKRLVEDLHQLSQHPPFGRDGTVKPPDSRTRPGNLTPTMKKMAEDVPPRVTSVPNLSSLEGGSPKATRSPSMEQQGSRGLPSSEQGNRGILLSRTHTPTSPHTEARAASRHTHSPLQDIQHQLHLNYSHHIRTPSEQRVIETGLDAQDPQRQEWFTKYFSF